MFDFLWNLFQQHTDAWISAIVTILPVYGTFFCLLYQRRRFGNARRKEQREIEKMKQKIRISQSKGFEERVQNDEKFVLNDARKMIILRTDFNHDIIIVEPLAPDDDTSGQTNGVRQNSSYCVLSRYLTKTDNVVQIIQARRGVAQDSLITGPYSEYVRFFATQETYAQQEKSEVPPSSNSGTLPHLDDPLLVLNTSLELPVAASLPLQADVLLVTVTEIETKAVLQVFQEKCQHTYERRCIGIKTYYDLGTVNDAHIFLVQSEMGVGGPGSSLLTVREGIQALGPSSVIMVGIAFGVDPHKQRIGDVLVSQQLHGYDLQRYGTAYNGTPTIISRGDRVTASAKLLDRFRSGSLDWPRQRGRWGRQVYFGTILSGEKLVDNIDYRNQLHALEPEAIGGEMEGVGLYAAAQNAKVDWILVKAICDWADGNKSGENIVVSDNGKSSTKNLKDQNQRRAAKNAALFTLHVLDNTRLV